MDRFNIKQLVSKVIPCIASIFNPDWEEWQNGPSNDRICYQMFVYITFPKYLVPTWTNHTQLYISSWIERQFRVKFFFVVDDKLKTFATLFYLVIHSITYACRLQCQVGGNNTQVILLSLISLGISSLGLEVWKNGMESVVRQLRPDWRVWHFS